MQTCVCTSFRVCAYVSGRCAFKGRYVALHLSWHPRMHWLRERKELHERYNHLGGHRCCSPGMPSGHALVCCSRPQAQEARGSGRDAQRGKARGSAPQQETASGTAALFGARFGGLFSSPEDYLFENVWPVFRAGGSNPCSFTQLRRCSSMRWNSAAVSVRPKGRSSMEKR